MTDAPATLTLHASTIAWDGRALLIEGPSGAGKSGLALALMAYGAQLVADDRTILTRDGDALIAQAPDTIRGRIEARGMGILKADPAGPTPVAAIVTMSDVETDRLPPRRSRNLLGIPLPLLHYVESPYFAASLLQYMKGGRDA
ncbi:HPr kinase/phosphorylase [Pseudooceanicola nitratireducens]|uniref:HPr kinase/phosphorylase n=1 Tax=Pseudooceanicola nitratireducens TaxID=517719 RepID=UPI0023F14B2D|nr:HPr kinase/phosphatase C-terminal domain-containing protein [Pseudooceanicola nitratireducens]